MSVGVKINYYGTSRPPIVVDPVNADVPPGGKVSFEVSGLGTGETFEVVFATQSGVQGPFPSSGSTENPSRGVYQGPNGDVLTDSADQPDDTDWPYTVNIKSGGVVIGNTDAKVIIKKE